MMNRYLIIVLFLVLASLVYAQDPDCSGIERWPTIMAFVHLKNAGIIKSENLDYPKTKTAKISSEKIGDNLYRQVHHVVFNEKSGKKIEVITVSDASNEECSVSGVEIFVISQHLGHK